MFFFFAISSLLHVFSSLHNVKMPESRELGGKVGRPCHNTTTNKKVLSLTHWDIISTSKPSQTDFFQISVQCWQERDWKQDASHMITDTTVQFSTQIQRLNTVSSTHARTHVHTHACTHNLRSLPHNLQRSSKMKATRCYAWRSSSGNKTVDQTNKTTTSLSFVVLYLTVSLHPESGGREWVLKQSVIKAVS